MSVYETPTKLTTDIQETLCKTDDLPNFNEIVATLPLDPTEEFYDLIVHNYRVFPSSDETSYIKVKLCKSNIIDEIQCLT